MRHDLKLAAAGVRLEPLGVEHASALEALTDDALWFGMSGPRPVGLEGWQRYCAAAVDAPDRYAFAVVGAVDGEVRGSTSFYDYLPLVPRVEIGHTFYGRPWWGGDTNPAAKLALLTHAFEVWGAQRVALRADARNARSIAAIQRLGASPEGVLRHHRVAGDGSLGDTAYFSIIAEEWPASRAGLRARLGLEG